MSSSDIRRWRNYVFHQPDARGGGERSCGRSSRLFSVASRSSSTSATVPREFADTSRDSQHDKSWIQWETPKVKWESHISAVPRFRAEGGEGCVGLEGDGDTDNALGRLNKL